MCSTEKRSTFRKFVPNDKIHRNDDYVKRVQMPDFSIHPHFTILNKLISKHHDCSKNGIMMNIVTYYLIISQSTSDSFIIPLSIRYLKLKGLLKIKTFNISNESTH